MTTQNGTQPALAAKPVPPADHCPKCNVTLREKFARKDPILCPWCGTRLLVRA